MVNHEDPACRYTVPRNNSPVLSFQCTLHLLPPFHRGGHREHRHVSNEPRARRINGTTSHVNYERKPRETSPRRLPCGSCGRDAYQEHARIRIVSGIGSNAIQMSVEVWSSSFVSTLITFETKGNLNLGICSIVEHSKSCAIVLLAPARFDVSRISAKHL